MDSAKNDVAVGELLPTTFGLTLDDAPVDDELSLSSSDDDDEEEEEEEEEEGGVETMIKSPSIVMVPVGEMILETVSVSVVIDDETRDPANRSPALTWPTDVKLPVWIPVVITSP